jgi:hypothetical protein
LQQVSDPIALDYWRGEYEGASPGAQREIARPIAYRVRRFYRNASVRRIVCQATSLDVRDIMDTGKIFLADLRGLGEIEGETLGALLISKFQVAAMSRQLNAEGTAVRYYLYVDEVQNFITTSLPKVFSEARKYGLSMVVANQFLQQLEGKTLEAIMGNVGTSILFRLGPKDAAAVASFVRPVIGAEDLVNLNRFEAVVKLQLHGETQPAFSLQTSPPLAPRPEAEAQMARIRQRNRRHYARHKDEVDAAIASRYEGYADNSVGQGAESGEEGYFG